MLDDFGRGWAFCAQMSIQASDVISFGSFALACLTAMGARKKLIVALFVAVGLGALAVSILSRTVVAPDEWPPLTQKQINQLANVLMDYRSHIDEIDVYAGRQTEAKKLFQSIRAAGKIANIPVLDQPGGGAPGRITILVSPENPAGSILRDSLKDYPIELKRTKGAEHKDVLIEIGEKL